MSAASFRFTIETIPHGDQRYPTVGDWYRDAEAMRIRVSETADPRDWKLVALHELVEAILCEHRGIDEAAVTKFDLDHLEDNNPGELPDAPYHREHVFAELIERMMAHELGRDWREYEAALVALEQ